MKKILIGVLVLSFLVTAFVGMTYAQRPMNRENFNHRHDGLYHSQRAVGMMGFGMNFEEINFTESQIDRMSELREEFYNDSSQLREDLRALNWEIRDLRLKNASNAEIGAVQDEIEVILSELNEMRFEMQEKMQNLLTDEQLELLEAREDAYQGRFGEKGFRSNRGHNFSDSYRFHQRSNRTNSGFAWCH